MDGILEDLTMGHWVLLEALLVVQKEALVGVLVLVLLEVLVEALVEAVLVTVFEMDKMVDLLVIHPVNPLVILLVDPLVVL